MQLFGFPDIEKDRKNKAKGAMSVAVNNGDDSDFICGPCLDSTIDLVSILKSPNSKCDVCKKVCFSPRLDKRKI